MARKKEPLSRYEFSMLRTYVVDGGVTPHAAARVLGITPYRAVKAAKIAGWGWSRYRTTDVEVGMRACSKCKRRFDLDCFPRNASTKLGRSYVCYWCTRAAYPAKNQSARERRKQPGMRGTGAYRIMTPEQRRICDKNWGVDPDLPFP